MGLKSEEKDIKQEAIDHYKRMIAWAKTQPPSNFPSIKTMEDSIKEFWYGTHCSYCKNYNFPDDEDGEDCGDCPLKRHDNCCNGLWGSLSHSLNWEKWIVNAKKVLAYIRRHG